MYQHLKFDIEGVTPGMLQHNVRLANPRDEFTKQIKLITSKRTKTEQDLDELVRLEWYGSLYINSGGRIIVPSLWIERCFVSAARKIKKGRDYEAALMCTEDPLLQYDGPEDIDALWESGKFIDVRTVVVSRSRVMRARVHFPDWRLTFTIGFLGDVLNRQNIIETLELAGSMIGLSTYRPRFGRFNVVDVTDV